MRRAVATMSEVLALMNMSTKSLPFDVARFSWVAPCVQEHIQASEVTSSHKKPPTSHLQRWSSPAWMWLAHTGHTIVIYVQDRMLLLDSS
eukprot:341435-Amphidinium_carterae.1